MSRVSIIYYTDNALNEPYFSLCQKELVRAAQGKPIFSVSQKPLDFGENICVGDIGRSHLSLYKQMLEGGKVATTDFVALAEHDCMYTPEHFDYIPRRTDIFYYNIHHYFVQGDKRGFGYGEFSYGRRRPLSMLICGRDIFLKAITEKVWLLENGWMIRKGKAGACEPGVTLPENALVKVKDDLWKTDNILSWKGDAYVGPEGEEAQLIEDRKVGSLAVEPGIFDNSRIFLAAIQQFKDLGKEVGRWKAKGFATVLPNIDIRTGQNFSGRRRGNFRRTFELPYWGKWSDVVGPDVEKIEEMGY